MPDSKIISVATQPEVMTGCQLSSYHPLVDGSWIAVHECSQSARYMTEDCNLFVYACFVRLEAQDTGQRPGNVGSNPIRRLLILVVP